MQIRIQGLDRIVIKGGISTPTDQPTLQVLMYTYMHSIERLHKTNEIPMPRRIRSRKTVLGRKQLLIGATSILMTNNSESAQPN